MQVAPESAGTTTDTKQKEKGTTSVSTVNMESVYIALRAVIFLLGSTLLIQTIFGEKTAQKSVILIVAGMIIMQADTVGDYLKNLNTIFDFDD